MDQEQFIDIEDSEDMDAKQIIAARGFSLQKINFRSPEGEACYACVLMRKLDEERFQKDRINGPLNLADYGEILCCGFGQEIPEPQRLFIEEMFRADS